MSSLRIILLCMVASILYGIAHDQITARLCVEYFSVFHPKIIKSTNPTLLALIWGVVATWWVGLLIGIPLAICSRAGRRSKIRAGQLVRPIGVLFAVIVVMAFAAGCLAHWAIASGRVQPLEVFPWMRDHIPPDRQIWFLVDLAAHNVAYFVGAIGGIVLSVRTFRSRRRLERNSIVDRRYQMISESAARESYERIAARHQGSLKKLAE